MKRQSDDEEARGDKNKERREGEGGRGEEGRRGEEATTFQAVEAPRPEEGHACQQQQQGGGEETDKRGPWLIQSSLA